MERIPFGSEQKIEFLAPSCPSCNAERGELHKYGCLLESCPQCGGRLLQCSCLALSLVDEFRLTRAVSTTLTKEDVLRMAEKSEAMARTYLEKAGFTWICENAPPELKVEIERKALEIIGGERRGDMVRVPLEKAAEALGMTIEEAQPIMNELEAECLYPGWDQRTGGRQN